MSLSSATGDGEYFPSRVDAWLGVLLGAAILVPLAVVAVGAISGRMTPAELALVLGASLPGSLFIAWMFRSTGYTLRRESLEIRCGPFRWSIPFDQIQSIRASRNPMSAPALSLHRLEIAYGKGSRMRISPRSPEEFVRALVARAPGLHLAPAGGQDLAVR